MFLGSTIDLLAPNYIGKILDEFRVEDFSAIHWVVLEWVGVALFSALCTFIREAIFGVTSQRLGRNLRQKFFESLINKDINFYDSNKTGEMLSRLSSDTQVVQDGLTTNVAMFIKSVCICFGCIILVATYNPWLLPIVVGGVAPQIIIHRWSAYYLHVFLVRL